MTSAVLLYGDVFTHYNVTAFYQTVKALKKKKKLVYTLVLFKSLALVCIKTLSSNLKQ